MMAKPVDLDLSAIKPPAGPCAPFADVCPETSRKPF